LLPHCFCFSSILLGLVASSIHAMTKTVVWCYSRYDMVHVEELRHSTFFMICFVFRSLKKLMSNNIFWPNINYILYIRFKKKKERKKSVITRWLICAI
jgi:hypothetical protein